MTPARISLHLALAGALALSAACGDGGGTQPGTLRFGQIGEIRLHLNLPLLQGDGELQQSLTWNSSGPWQLTETISYRGALGDENTLRSFAPPEVLASEYAIWITQVNDIQTLFLFDPDVLDPSLSEECGLTRTRITLLIRDDALGEQRQWIRCVEGGLGSLVTAGAGPDAGAARVANAALLLRDYVFPPLRGGFTSSFHGSFPFATLARGEDTPVQLSRPSVIESQAAWSQFWVAHTGSVSGMPTVDFTSEVVLVAAIGERFEVGETVEVRRVLPVGEGTLVDVVWRRPGNFCSPVSRTHRPFHVVVAPRLPKPITFAEARLEEVPCGG
jgi:hypothetical protein